MRRSYHLIDRFHDSQHFIITDLPVAIDIVQLKGPVQFILHLATRRDRQRANKLLEIYSATPIGIEDSEYIICKRSRISIREELAVDLLKVFLGEVPGGAVLEET